MTADYPLNCLSNTGDGFSGWFAISNPTICNDFCYWSTSDSSTDSEEEYTAFNTADPHRITVISNGNKTAYWECIFDSAGDEILTSAAVGERWVDAYRRYIEGEVSASSDVNGIPFPYLKCHKGSGEKLSTWDRELVQSALFWKCWIVICSSVVLFQIMAGVWYWKRRKRRYQVIRASTGDLAFDTEQEEELAFHSLQLSESVNVIPPALRDVIRLPPRDQHQPTEHLTPRCKLCSTIANTLCSNSSARNKWMAVLRFLLVLTLNTLLVFTVAFSSISLMEINNNPLFKDSMRRWTPACSNPDLVCEAANNDVNKESASPNGEMAPFSYLIASDAQLHWFNGEFAQMGLQNLPPACSPSDSCWSCTRKHGRETNLRLKRAWESLMIGEVDGMERRDGTVGSLPVPDTLIMNGKNIHLQCSIVGLSSLH